MRLKRLFSIVLAGIMTAGLLTGCGSSKTDNTASTTTESSTESTESTEDTNSDETAEPTQAADETTDSTVDSSTEGNGNVLVVYYSATGSTKSVAETIAGATGGDLFEIQPKEPYTSDDLNWTNDDSRVSREHENEDQRDVELVSAIVDNWDSYDTVFIGYPIWWGIAAWPVDNFIKSNDFTGKTVIPFCTSASSGLGDSGNLLEEMAGTGNWQEGQRFSSGASEEDVTSWVESLNLN